MSNFGCIDPQQANPFRRVVIAVSQNHRIAIQHTANTRIAFNAGDHGVSVIMAVSDYLAVAQPTAVFAFGRDA